MKKITLSLLAGATALIFTAGALSAQPFFSDDFEGLTVGLEPGDVPFGNWDVSVINTYHATRLYAPGMVQVAAGAVFPGSTQHIQARNAQNYDLGIVFDRGMQIVTASFDLISRPNADGAAPIYLLASFYGSNPHETLGHVATTNRLHASGINTVTNQVAGGGGDPSATFGVHNQLVHFNMIMNNSVNEISHFVGGTEYFIPAGQASVWADGVHLLNYNYLRNSNTSLDQGLGQEIQAFSFTTLAAATARNSYDLNNFAIYDGVFVIPEPSTYALIFGGLALAGAYLVRRRL